MFGWLVAAVKGLSGANGATQIGRRNSSVTDIIEAIRLDPTVAQKVIADRTEAIRLNPNDAEAHYRRGVCHCQTDEIDNAIADFTEVIRLGHPRVADVYNYRGVCHFVKGFAPIPPYGTASPDLYAAIDDFDEAIRLDPKMAVAYYNRGRCHITFANLNNANPQPSMHALAESPGVPSIDLTELTVPGAVLKLVAESEARENVVLPLSCDNGVLRIVMSDPGNFDRVQKLRIIFDMDIEPVFAPRQQLIEAINRHYWNTEVELVGAEFTAARGDNLIAFAIEDFTEAIRPDPKESGNYYWRARCFGRAGEHDQAMADYTEVIRLDPKAAVAYFDRGQCHAQKDQHDQAIADFTEAIRLDPNEANNYDGSPHCERGRCYDQTGEHDKAIADFKEALRVGALFLHGELDTLLAHLDEAIRLHPHVAENYYWRGRFYQWHPLHDHENGDSEFDLSLDDEATRKPSPSKAMVDFTKAIQLDQTVAEYYLRWAESTEDCNAAIGGYTEAIRLDPNMAEAYFNRGHLYCQTGELDQAIADYTEVIRLLASPNSPYSGILTREHLTREAYYNRSLAYLERGDRVRLSADDMQGVDESDFELSLDAKAAPKTAPAKRCGESDQDKGRADEIQWKRLCTTFGQFNPARIIN